MSGYGGDSSTRVIPSGAALGESKASENIDRNSLCLIYLILTKSDSFFGLPSSKRQPKRKVPYNAGGLR